MKKTGRSQEGAQPPQIGRWRRLLVVAALAALLGGCITDATDTCFTWDNEFDADSDAAVCAEPTDDGLSGNVAIISVTTINEVVILSNLGTLDQDLTAWTLANESSTLDTDTYTFPTFSLLASAFVRVHSDQGTDDADDLYWDGAAHWDSGDTAVLKDDAGTPIDSCGDGDPCWNGG